MIARSAYFDFDIAKMDDAALVVLATDLQLLAARDLLIVRYREENEHLITGLVYRYGCCGDRPDDLQQEAFFWMIEAIKSYDPYPAILARRRPRSFHSFRYAVLVRRFFDYRKGRRSAERHFDRHVTVSDGSPCHDQSDRRQAGRTIAVADRDGNLVAAAELHETVERVHVALARLDGDDRRILELKMAGHSLPEIAAELGTTVGAMHHQWRKLRDAMCEELAEDDR